MDRYAARLDADDHVLGLWNGGTKGEITGTLTEIVAAQWAVLFADLNFPHNGGPRFKLTAADLADGTVTELPDLRPAARFANGQPSADWDQETRTLTVDKGQANASVDIQVLTAAGEIDTSFGEPVDMTATNGQVIKAEFLLGVATIPVSTVADGRIDLPDSKDFSIDVDLVIVVRVDAVGPI